MKAIKGRRSIRKYSDEKISKETIQKIIEAANWAPSACNYQNWKFIVIDNGYTKQKIVEMGGAVFIKDAPMGILVVYNDYTTNPEYPDYVESAAAAIQNMLLAAHSFGLGSCWVNMLPTKSQIRKLFSIPKNYDVIGYIALGYPAEKPTPHPRKQLQEIMNYNSFNFKEEKIGGTIKKAGAKLFFNLPLSVKKKLRPAIEKKFVKKFNEEKTERNWTVEDVGKHWDETTDYDDINERTYSYSRRFIDSYRMSDIQDGAHVLDISCRTGNGTAYFAERIKNAKFVCCDCTKKMLEIATENLKEKKVNFETKLFTSLDLPFENETFDNILSFETIEHMPDPTKFTKELARVTKIGGEVIITCPNWLWEPVHALAALTGIHHSEGPHKFLHHSEAKKYIKDAGLKIKREETTVFIPYGPKFITKPGEIFEKIFKKTLMPMLGLRRIFICEKL